MFLSGTILKNVQNVNSFVTTTEVKVRQGNPSTLYFQTVDKEQTDANGRSLRYMPAVGASMTVSIPSISSVQTVNKVATQPFSQDPSIWAINILATDVMTTGNLIFTLTEGAVMRTAVIDGAIIVESTNPSMC